MNRPVEFWLDPAAEQLGVRFDVALIKGVEVRRENPELERWKRPIQKECRLLDLEADVVLAGYRLVLAAAGNSEAVASPEYLLRVLQKHGRLPTINTCVDAYNIASLLPRVVASAHDLDKLEGPVRLVRLSQPTPFEPLGSGPDEMIPCGEFGVQDDRHMLCRLNCKQNRLSSVGPQTRNLLVYVQGNPALEGVALRAALDAVCEAIIRFNGGQREDAMAERVSASAQG